MQKATVSNIEEALAALGVSDDTLSSAERRELDEKGYLVLPGLIDRAWLSELQDTFDRLVAEEGAVAGSEVHQEPGTQRLSNLMNKSPVFDACYTNPKVLAAMYHILKEEFKVSAMNGREPLKGAGYQAWHEDWNEAFFDTPEENQWSGDYRKPGDPFYVAISLWMLDDFTSQNGPTRVVPGSHHWRAPQFEMEDRRAEHPDQVLLTGDAGTVAIMNSHLWHGGTTNQNGARRRVLHPYYVARQFPQQQDQRTFIRESTYNRISPAARYLLDVEGAF